MITKKKHINDPNTEIIYWVLNWIPSNDMEQPNPKIWGHYVVAHFVWQVMIYYKWVAYAVKEWLYCKSYMDIYKFYEYENIPFNFIRWMPLFCCCFFYRAILRLSFAGYCSIQPPFPIPIGVPVGWDGDVTVNPLAPRR